MRVRWRRELLVLFACYGCVLALPLPLILLYGWLTGAMGQLLLLVLLFGWLLVASVTTHSFADNHHGLVMVAALLLYLAAFSLFAVPTHVMLRDRRRAHDIALGFLTLVFVILMVFAYARPTTEVPV